MSAQTISTSQSNVTATPSQGPSLVMGLVLLIALGTMWGWLLGVGSDSSNSTPVAVETQVSTQTPIQSTAVAAPSSVVPAPIVEPIATPVTVSAVSAISTPAQPTLTVETQLYSVAFQPGRVDLSPEEKMALGARAKAERFSDAAKIHLQGRSGNTTVAAEERQRLAFGRAWSVKQALVNDFGIEPAKVRMFTFTVDHYGNPRVDVKAFETAEAAAEDAKNRLVRK